MSCLILTIIISIVVYFWLFSKAQAFFECPRWYWNRFFYRL